MRVSSSASRQSGVVVDAEQIRDSDRISSHNADSSASSIAAASLLNKSAVIANLQ
jgi:ribonuclease HII